MSLTATEFGPAERVYVENEWYDGPRAGIANLFGKPHRFVSQFDEEEDEYLGSFLVWPIGESELAIEQEQWRIFVSWNDAYEAGEVDTQSHPGHPGTNRRWDEIARMLNARRKSVPSGARRARAQMVSIKGVKRYSPFGPDYQLCWQLLGEQDDS